MHVIVLILTIFHLAHDGKPAYAEVRAGIVPDEQTCIQGAQVLPQLIQQKDPTVIDVESGCFAVANSKSIVAAK